MCYNDIIFGGALVSPEISKKYLRTHFFFIYFFVACSLVSYLSRVARINVTEQVLASESRHAARRRKNASSISDPPCRFVLAGATMQSLFEKIVRASAAPFGLPRACNRLGRLGAFYFCFLKFWSIALWNENIILYVFVKKRAAFVCFCQKRERPTGGKKWTWTRQFARPRPSSTSDEGGSVVPNSRLITAVIWISRTPMGDTGPPLGSTQTTTTATAMRQKTRPPRNQTRATCDTTTPVGVARKIEVVAADLRLKYFFPGEPQRVLLMHGKAGRNDGFKPFVFQRNRAFAGKRSGMAHATVDVASSNGTLRSAAVRNLPPHQPVENMEQWKSMADGLVAAAAHMPAELVGGIEPFFSIQRKHYDKTHSKLKSMT